ncbi:hypothetical protein ABZY11_27130, partial [Streptomyces sp. NPDC006510]
PAASGPWPDTVPPVHGTGASTGPFPAQQPPPQAPATGPVKARSGRPALLIAAVAVAFATGIGGTVWVLDKNSDDGNNQSADDKGPAPQRSGQTGTDGGSTTPDPAGSPSGSKSKKPVGPSYTLVFQDKPLTLRTPSGLDWTYVDLDAPRVDPTAEIDSEDLELSAGYDTLRLDRALGKASGASPEECRTAAEQNPLPSSVPSETLIKDKTIAAGDLMCSVTSEGNLAQWKISDVVFNDDKELPTYEGSLTLWKING